MKKIAGAPASRMNANGMIATESTAIFARRTRVSRERGEAYEASTEFDIA